MVFGLQLEMAAQCAERGNDHQFAGAGHDRFVFELPGVLMRNVNGVEPDL